MAEIYSRLRDHGQKGVVIEGLSGIDIALWDIKGKHFGVPVHRLLGGGIRTQVQAYATGLYRRKRAIRSGISPRRRRVTSRRASRR